MAEPPVLGAALPLEEPAEGAPQIPALLFSLASWPMVGPAVGVLDFLMPALALPQSAPKASPPAAGGLAPGLVTGFMLAMVVGVLEALDMPGRPDTEAGFAGCA